MMPCYAFIFAPGVLVTGRPVLVAIRGAFRDALIRLCLRVQTNAKRQRHDGCYP
jgi:hypothetical protein